jgi:methionyl-tRNA formyltransferase
LIQTLSNLEDGEAKAIPQDNALATVAPILKKEDGRIDWRSPAQQIHNLVRGFQPWPGAHALFRGQSLHIWRSRLSSRRFDLAPGALIDRQGVFAVGGDGFALELLEVQLEGRKRMTADVFANGHRLTQQDVLA